MSLVRFHMQSGRTIDVPSTAHFDDPKETCAEVWNKTSLSTIEWLQMEQFIIQLDKVEAI